MTKFNIFVFLGILLLAATASTQAALVTATNSTGGIADGSQITRSVDIAESGDITDVNITVEWSKCPVQVDSNFFCSGTDEFSSFPDEPSMNLVGPTGASTVLFPPSFFTMPLEGVDVTNTFDDQAGTALSDTIQSGTFRPVGPLSVFNGLEIMGLWTLEIGDLFLLDPAAFRSFTLNITTAEGNGGGSDPVPDPAPVPEPGTLALLGLGLLGIGLGRR
ncbi:MAG: PEP-CTERM sorting domain-containing protein, partial [Marinobacter sp.]